MAFEPNLEPMELRFSYLKCGKKRNMSIEGELFLQENHIRVCN